MISTRSVELVIDTVVCLTLAKWETVSGQFGGYLMIIAVLASQATVWHSLATIRDAIQQTNAIILTACGSDERPCQAAAHRGQIEFGEIKVRTHTRDGFSCGYSRYNPCWIKASGEDGLN